MSKIVVISGGIGSGKSMLCSILRAMGYEVYDCDSRAKSIMDSDAGIKRVIAEQICPDAVVDGVINRQRLAEVVFTDEELLNILNEAVHTAVKYDIMQWAEKRNPAFVETAIMYQSGLDRVASQVWEVTAPREVRIDRVMLRSGLSREAVEQRMAVQDGYIPEHIHPVVYPVVNDGEAALLPQVEALINQLLD